MSTGPDDERRQPSEPTFADVMNGFSFDAGRSSRRRRWGRRRGTDVDTPEGAVAEAPAPAAMPAPQPAQVPQAPLPGQPTAPIDLRGVPADQGGLEGAASAVRPYAWTRGRTKSGLDLAIEALVSTSQRAKDQMGLLQMEHRAVAELCEQTRSVAEVAALLSIPLGVARVVLGDMVGLNLVTVHQTASSTGNEPDLALMERVLSGLRRL
ncbi:uncharacterized protein DUF742 [Pseudonocardia hierapolitana]|uniref:Uncharacterized protein DUF742 n=1 Tax=Pseudonocardia hierapolitana TaxID=1128676 RepID=A0A561SSZ1_9PSEU|nr:DUF742 domain-containing protein [Pseudonocardia hierapolitana]TWF77987.1 uncharacterized protein DUF742 [Pseudonocardia hierapolitana]